MKWRFSQLEVIKAVNCAYYFCSSSVTCANFTGVQEIFTQTAHKHSHAWMNTKYMESYENGITYIQFNTNGIW